MKGFLKFLGILLLVIILIVAGVAVAGIVTLNKASAPVEAIDYDVEETNLVMSMLGTIVGEDIVLTEGNVNSLIKTYAGNISSDKFTVKDLFVVLDGSKGSVHADVALTTGFGLVDRDYHLSADFTVDYKETFVTVIINNITCGELTLDAKVLKLVKSYVELPEFVNISSDNVIITYDCAQLDPMIEGILGAKLQDPAFIESMGDYGKLFAAVPVEQIPDVVNVVIDNICLEDGKITVTASIIDVNALLKAAGSAALAFLFGGGNK